MPTENPEIEFRLETDGGVPYRLMQGYPTIKATEESVTATEKYLIRAQDVAKFFTESMPASALIAGQVIRVPGRSMPGAAFLTTKSIDFDPLLDTLPGDPFRADYTNNGLTLAKWKATYNQYYVATISYETSQLDNEEQKPDDKNDSPEAFLEHSINIGGQLLNYAPKKAKVVPDAPVSQHPEFMDPANIPAANKEENKDPGMPSVKLIPSIEHNLRWKFVLNPPWDTIRATLGCVNEAKYPLFFNAPAGTILFTGLSGSQQFYWTGRVVAPGLSTPGTVRTKPWNLDFKFSERYINDAGGVYGWNHVWSPSKEKWVLLVMNDGAKLIYPKANLLQVFQTVSPIEF